MMNIPIIAATCCLRTNFTSLIEIEILLCDKQFLLGVVNMISTENEIVRNAIVFGKNFFSCTTNITITIMSATCCLRTDFTSVIIQHLNGNPKRSFVEIEILLCDKHFLLDVVNMAVQIGHNSDCVAVHVSSILRNINFSE